MNILYTSIAFFIAFILLKIISKLVSVSETVIGSALTVASAGKIERSKNISSFLSKLGMICFIASIFLFIYSFYSTKMRVNQALRTIPISSSEELP